MPSFDRLPGASHWQSSNGGGPGSGPPQYGGWVGAVSLELLLIWPDILSNACQKESLFAARSREVRFEARVTTAKLSPPPDCQPHHREHEHQH